MKRPLRGTASVLTVLVISLAGCSSSGADGNTAGTVRDTSLHAVMSDTIDTLLTQLDVLVFDPHRTETELAQLRHRRADDIAAAASALQDATTEILRLQPTLALEPQAAATFRTLAGELYDGAAELEQLALERRMQAMDATMNTIRQTCSQCHDLYRGF